MKAIVEYDGSEYAGFQRQSTLPSIQGALERAVLASTNGDARVAGAARTDAGAHARGQVVSFVTDTRLDDAVLLRALNAHLPNDIAVQSLETVNDRFDPRRCAIRREYHYLVAVRPVAAPLWRGRAHQVRRSIDVPSMRDAGACLVGVHDFAAFGSASTPGGSTVRELFELRLVSEGELVRFELVGSGFLQHMIRTMVATLLEVGAGNMPSDDVRNILESRDRGRAAAPVPACGLYLMNVTYGPNGQDNGLN